MRRGRAAGRRLGRPGGATVADWRTLERRRFAEFAAAPEPVAEVRDTYAPAPGGPVPVRVHRPAGDAPAGTLVWLHGGGWVVGSPELCDDQARALANAAGCVVVSADYRLAPEHPFPAALEDSFAVVRWVAAGGAGPVRRLIVAGDSAGGNLAAAVTLVARDAGEPAIDLQVLVHPAVQRDADTASMRTFAEGHGLSADAMRWFWEQYAGPAGEPLVSPMLAESLANLPAALVVTAGCDILRDEGEAYARRLRAAGVPVTLRRYDGMIHGFLAHAGAIDRARTALVEIAADIRAQVEVPA